MSLHTCDGTPDGDRACFVCGPGLKQQDKIDALQAEVARLIGERDEFARKFQTYYYAYSSVQPEVERLREDRGYWERSAMKDSKEAQRFEAENARLREALEKIVNHPGNKRFGVTQKANSLLTLADALYSIALDALKPNPVPSQSEDPLTCIHGVYQRAHCAKCWEEAGEIVEAQSEEKE